MKFYSQSMEKVGFPPQSRQFLLVAISMQNYLSFLNAIKYQEVDVIMSAKIMRLLCSFLEVFGEEKL